ncbi:MAG: 2-oxoisovalerate dehydrogenase [Candidatus Binataceae bacterium]
MPMRGEHMVDSEIVFAVQESPEGGFEARALGHPIFTQSDTFDELKEMVRDAVSCHFENATRPRLIRLHLVRDEVTRA